MTISFQSQRLVSHRILLGRRADRQSVGAVDRHLSTPPVFSQDRWNHSQL